jgi:peptide/nickel transport system permease protein
MTPIEPQAPRAPIETGAPERAPSVTRLRAAAALLALVILAALLAPWLAPQAPSALDLDRRLAKPSPQHPLGQDELGRDILSRLLFGARASLATGLAVVLLAGALGTVIGGLAGIAGGRVDALLMRLVDVVLAFPGLLLAIALVAMLGPALSHVVLALVLIGWVGYARLVRGQAARLRESEFVLAARASGAGWVRVFLVHVLPNLAPLLLVQASLSMAGAMLAEASLSFLGLGLQPPTPSWGAMVNAGRGHLLDAPHLALLPGLALCVVVACLNVAADALGERLQGRRALPAAFD